MSEDPHSPVNSTKKRRAIVVRRPGFEDLKVGGLSLAERWSRALAGYSPSDLDRRDLGGVLAAMDASVLLVDGSAVLDDESINKIASASCGDDEIVGFDGAQVARAPVVLMGAGAARKVSAPDGLDWGDFPAVLDRLSERDDVVVRIERIELLLFRIVVDKPGAKQATWELLKRLRLRSGGFIAKVVNRHVSIRITRLLLPFRITPNMMTTFAGLLGLLSVYVLMLGGYVWGIVGTGIMQLSSILDGVDGEIARMKYQASRFGKYYDSVWDEVNNALFMVAVGYHQYLYYDFFWFFPVGIFTGAVGFIYACANWRSKYKYGIGLYWWFDKHGAKVLDERKANIKTQWKSLLTRDSYFLWFFLLAIASLLPVLMVAMFCSSAVVVVLLFIHVVIVRAKW